MVDISIPQKPHFLPLFWSSLTTGACRLLRPKFVVYEDRHLVQEKLSFDCWCKGTTILSWKQIFGLQIFRSVCKCLTDSTLQRYFGNQLLHFDRIGRKWRLVTQNFRKAVIWSWSCSVKILRGMGQNAYSII